MSKFCEHRWKEKNKELLIFHCKKCNALGWRSMQGYGFSGHRKLKTGNIIPYICSAPECQKHATMIWDKSNGVHYCEIHDKPKEFSNESKEYMSAIAKEERRVKEANAKAFAELKRIRKEYV
jgi:hypothetical protein